MSVALSTRKRRTSRAAIGLIVAGLVLLLGAANAHLVDMAVTSHSDCVAHLRQGDAGIQSGSFRAAKLACSPEAR